MYIFFIIDTSEFIRLEETLNFFSNYTSTHIDTNIKALDINKEPQAVSTSNTSVSSSSSSSSSLTNYTNKFEWNCEPFNVLCIFPYVIGFSRECIEIRLLINGNLINSIIMSDIRLVASKVSCLFASFFT